MSDVITPEARAAVEQLLQRDPRSLFVLLVDHERDYDPPEPYGPFETVEQAQAFAEEYRERLGLPREATPEHNDEWTNQGWYFGIWPLSYELPLPRDGNAG